MWNHKNTLPISFDWYSVRVVPLYRMCGRVASLRVAFPCRIAGIMPGFVKKFVNSKRIFLYKPYIYIKLFSASEQTHCDLVIFYSQWVTVACFWMFTKVVYLQCWLVVVVTWQVPHETAAISAYALYTPYTICTSFQYHFILGHWLWLNRLLGRVMAPNWWCSTVC